MHRKCPQIRKKQNKQKLWSLYESQIDAFLAYWSYLSDIVEPQNPGCAEIILFSLTITLPFSLITATILLISRKVHKLGSKMLGTYNLEQKFKKLAQKNKWKYQPSQVNSESLKQIIQRSMKQGLIQNKKRMVLVTQLENSAYKSNTNKDTHLALIFAADEETTITQLTQLIKNRLSKKCRKIDSLHLILNHDILNGGIKLKNIRLQNDCGVIRLGWCTVQTFG